MYVFLRLLVLSNVSVVLLSSLHAFHTAQVRVVQSPECRVVSLKSTTLDERYRLE